MLHPMIEKHIDRSGPSECWRWIGPSYPTGGPKIVFQGQEMGARRLVREIVKGDLAKSVSVHVTCGNVCCMNPEHMT